MRLIEIPWSHNCVKVRLALDHKGVDYETQPISLDRRPVKQASGQWLVPVLVDGDRAIADSTAILLHLEQAHPEPPLLPADREARAECLVLEDWADRSFMALTRRLAYANVTAAQTGELFFPRARPAVQPRLGGALARLIRARFGIRPRRTARDREVLAERAQVAVDRLGGRPHLVGDRLTIADIALATMTGPLALARPDVTAAPAVRALVEWSNGVLGPYAYSIENVRRRAREALAKP